MPTNVPMMSDGVAFKLQEDGTWSPEEVPKGLPATVTMSGHLTIDGYRTTIFETPDGEMWAQKSSDVIVTDSDIGPEDVSEEINSVAAYIERSPSPSKVYVATVIRSILDQLR